MLSAKEARKISNSELLQIVNLIREEAYRGGDFIKLDYIIDDSTIKVLEDYGYNVEVKEIPIYYETPYGKIEDNPSVFRKQTVIDW